MDNNDRSNKKIVLQATTIMILIALFLVVIGYMFLKFYSGYRFSDLVSDIVGNLIGVLAAFLLFDILYNKMTQDAYAKETSQQITKTLMGDPDTLDVFSDNDKEVFMESLIHSIMRDTDASDMVVDNIRKHIHNNKALRFRKSFNYTITLTSECPSEYKMIPGLEECFYVQENLNYEVKYLGNKDKNFSSKEIYIGFSFSKLSLDEGLMESDDDSDFSRCIFNEGLDIPREAVRYFKKLPADELAGHFDRIFTPALKIDNSLGVLKRVSIEDTGIIAVYHVDYDVNALQHNIRVIFHMPKRWGTIFEVTLVDPTKDPKITFDYMPDKMEVTMYSYLNKQNEANEGAYEMKNGLYDIAVKDEWIYPKSGIVFMVEKKSVV